MKNKHIRRMALAVALVWLAGPDPTTLLARQDEQEWSRRFDIGPDGSLELTNVSGDIIVRGGDTDQVQVEAVKRVHAAGSEAARRRQLESVEIQVAHTANRLRIHTRYDQTGRRDRDINVSVDFEVIVPQAAAVSVKSVSGDVEVENVRGEARAESVSGNVGIRNAERLILAKSVSGGVEVESTKGAGELELSSVSGNVRVRGLEASRCDLNSTSGDIEITEAACGRASLDTVSGDVLYIGALIRSGRYEFKSHSGDVRIVIPEDVGFEIDAQSFSGEIESDFPLTVHELGGERRSVSGVYADGSAYIEATTFSGDVTIEKR